MPLGYDCWTLTPTMQEWLTPTEDDFDVSKPRLSITTECPESLEHCNDEQMRIVVYYKINRYWYGKGNVNVRNIFPHCVISQLEQILDVRIIKSDILPLFQYVLYKN